MVFYMTGIIHMVRPTIVCISKYFSFLRESTDVYSGVCRRHLGHNYPEKLKLLTQKRRGTGVRTRLEPNSDSITHIPKSDWQSYLKNVESERELFSCISKRQARDGADKQMVKY